jgi:hypothetical protein
MFDCNHWEQDIFGFSVIQTPVFPPIKSRDHLKTRSTQNHQAQTCVEEPEAIKLFM